MHIPRLIRLPGRACGLALALAGFIHVGVALAQTCASPLSLVDGQTAIGDTCLATNSLPYIGWINSEQNDVVYRIHSEATQSGSLTFGAPTFDGMTAVVLNQCGPNVSIAAAYQLPYDGPTLTLPTLPAGDNYLVITGDPSAPVYVPPEPGSCGLYSFTANLPDSRPGSCGTPLRYTSGTRRSGDTCAAPNSVLTLADGAFYSPQNDLVYRLDPSRIVNHRLYIGPSSYNLTAVLGSSCSGGTTAIAEVPAGTSGILNIPANVTSTQTLVVTAYPNGPDSACGSFTLTDLEPGVITDGTAFAAALHPDAYLERFSLAPPHATPQLMTFAKSGYGYRVTPVGTAAQLQFVNDTHGNPQALSVTANSSARSMRITFVGGPVNAFGGRVNVRGSTLLTQPGVLTVTILARGHTKVYTLRGSDEFRGFTSRTRIDEILVSSSATGRLAIDDFLVGFTDTP